MAYSRWNKYECWYTFWTSAFSESTEFKLPTKKRKYNQYFEICDDPSYFVSYGDLKIKGLKKVVKEIQDHYRGNKTTELNDYTRLRWYLIQFISDVDDHFKWSNFFFYEWYLPIRNKIYWFFRKLKKSE